MTVKMSTTFRNAMADEMGASLDSGYIEFRSGTQPANPQTAATGTLLATVTLSSNAFGSASSGVITANFIGVVEIDTTGTVAWARLYQADDTVVLDCSVGTSSADIIVSSTAFTAGVSLEYDTVTYTHPES